ncbi:MAG TPA: hypothetical protein VFB89_11345 [Gemmatimonadales bacterium]|nr:hypothetical protein [Gemmatimonadales bacterium]
MHRPAVSRVVLSALLVAALVGCRTVWVHAGATEQKYRDDTARCKYGMTAAERDRLMADPTAQVPPHRRDWQECMQLLGWTRETEPRAHAPWDTP